MNGVRHGRNTRAAHSELVPALQQEQLTRGRGRRRGGQGLVEGRGGRSGGRGRAATLDNAGEEERPSGEEQRQVDHGAQRAGSRAREAQPSQERDRRPRQDPMFETAFEEDGRNEQQQGFRREAGRAPGTASSGGEKRGAEAAGLAGGRQRSSGPGGSGLRRRGEEEERYGAPQYLGNEEEDGRQWQKPTYSQRGQGFGKGEVMEELKTIYRFFRDTTRNVRAAQGLPVDHKVDSDMEAAWTNTYQNVSDAMELGMGPSEEEQLKLWAKSSAQVYAGIMVDAVGQDYGPMVKMNVADVFARWGEAASLKTVGLMVQRSLREVEREVVKEVSVARTNRNQLQSIVGMMGQGSGGGGARNGGAGGQPVAGPPRPSRPGSAQRQQGLPPPPSWRLLDVCDDWRGYTPGNCARGPSCKFARSHTIGNVMGQAQPR